MLLSKHFCLQLFFLKDWFFLLLAKSLSPEVHPWRALKEEISTFGSPDPWKLHFQHTFWLQRTSCPWLINTIFPCEYYGLVTKYTKSYHPNQCIKVGNYPPPPSPQGCLVCGSYHLFCNQRWPGHSVMLSSDFSFLCMSKHCWISVIYS